MAIFDGAYPPLLGGITQQHPGMALPNQVADQLNMVSDPVTGLRRRPGFSRDRVVGGTPAATGGLNEDGPGGSSLGKPKMAFKADIGTASVHVRVCPSDGCIYFYTDNADGSLSYWTGFGPFNYLKASGPQALAYTCLRGEVYILNKEAAPPNLANYPTVPTTWGLNKAGYMWIKAGQFSKTYTIEIDTAGVARWYSYTTASGTSAGDAATSTPGAIADKLRDMINADAGASGTNLQAFSYNGVVFVQRTDSLATDFKVFTNAGSAYAVASTSCNVNQVTDLPSKLGSEQQNFCMSVGINASSLIYYRWDYDSGLWVECAGPGRRSGITGMPIRVYMIPNGVAPVVEGGIEWPLALAGDANTNPYPAFTDNIKITGIASFQGRLVLMSGSYVCFSDSQNPKLFMRTTVSQILDSDAVEVASGSINNASYTHAVQYNRDLLLFANGQISVVPGNNLLTMKTAQIVPSNSTNMLTSVPPVQAGNMVMFPVHGADAAGNFSGFDALFPSQYTTSQYAVEQLTDHLPQLFPGKPAFIASAGNSGFVAVSYALAPREIFIYQYIWKNQELALNAWHRWGLPGNILSMHIANDRLYVGCAAGSVGREVIGSVSLTQANGADLSGMVPFLDFFKVYGPGSTALSIPEYQLVEQVAVYEPSDYAGEKLKYDMLWTSGTGYTLRPDYSFPDTAKYAAGFPFESRVTLNAPSLRDANGRPYMQNKVFWVSLRMAVQNCGNFTMSTTYRGDFSYYDDVEISPVDWSSPSVVPGKAKVLDAGSLDVPLDGEVSYVSVTLKTSETHEMNFTGFEYTIRTEKQHRHI